MTDRLGRQLVVAGVATAWGAVGLFVKGVDLDAAGIVTWRVALAAATAAALAGVVGRGGLLRVPAGRRRILAGASVLLAAHWWLLFETITLSTVTVGVLFAYLAPISLAALAPWRLQERLLAAVVPDETFGLRTAVGGALVPAAGLTVALQPAAAPGSTPVRRRAVVGR